MASSGPWCDGLPGCRFVSAAVAAVLWFILWYTPLSHILIPCCSTFCSALILLGKAQSPPDALRDSPCQWGLGPSYCPDSSDLGQCTDQPPRSQWSMLTHQSCLLSFQSGAQRAKLPGGCLRSSDPGVIFFTYNTQCLGLPFRGTGREGGMGECVSLVR